MNFRRVRHTGHFRRWSSLSIFCSPKLWSSHSSDEAMNGKDVLGEVNPNGYDSHDFPS
jgi:hypothetical protein